MVDLIPHLDLRWPWVLPVVAVVVLALVARWWWVARRAETPSGLLVLAARMRRLPRYRTLLRRRRIQAWGSLVAAIVMLAGAALLVARPQRTETESLDGQTRDLMLCLDASASMDPYNQAVVSAVQKIVGDLPGDRVGLTLFSGSAVTIFPLTDDISYVKQRLREADRAFAKSNDDYFTGVQLKDGESSLIGDGLVSCARRMGDDPDRSRAVILSSDNDPNGSGVYSLAQASQFVDKLDVRVYGIGAPTLDTAQASTREQDFRSAVSSTGGELENLDGDGTAQRIVRGIDQLEQSRIDRPTRTTSVDDPGIGVLVVAAGGVLLGLVVVVAALGGLLDAFRRRRVRGGTS
ncbi:vWA domain-containing protein [Nocardioides acrostichi]|uniref:VWA domain-containing protein n=1 Tax=Nocardioides acrostichi TaxID=2784339 RepID=A0A930Y9B7_9ACTN|nr:VWA domain-containing protein [Nocardioides acrostichi]MBF4164002.1 VWA domain-containing protein [Nocardioides acrostichi]